MFANCPFNRPLKKVAPHSKNKGVYNAFIYIRLPKFRIYCLLIPAPGVDYKLVHKLMSCTLQTVSINSWPHAFQILLAYSHRNYFFFSFTWDSVPSLTDWIDDQYFMPIAIYVPKVLSTRGTPAYCAEKSLDLVRTPAVTGLTLKYIID